jgi:hypothetical protein
MAGAVAALLIIAALVTKSTDAVRNFTAKYTLPKWTWNVVPVLIGVGYCLGWQIEVTTQFAKAIPALASSADRFKGVAGQVFTGMAAGALAGGWHEVFDALSGIAKRSRAL